MTPLNVYSSWQGIVIQSYLFLFTDLGRKGGREERREEKRRREEGKREIKKQLS